VLSSPTLLDGAEITPFNFTKGDDDWDPLPDLISGDVEVGVDQVRKEPKVIVYSFGNKLYISNVQTKTRVNVFNVQGLLVNAFATNFDTHVNLDSGFWIVQVNNREGHKAVKVYAR
jgi:exo-poly-alpha-galacturonosidase